MATCSGWYYKGPVWRQDSLVAIGAHSQGGALTRQALVSLAGNQDAKAFIGALDYVGRLGIKGLDDKDRNPFQCAEPAAVYELLKKGAGINQIFISQTHETRSSTYGDYSAYLKPCDCCQHWLTKQDRQGVYMVDIKTMYRYHDLNTAVVSKVGS